MESTSANGNLAEGRREHPPQGIVGAVARVVALFFLLSIWSTFLAVAYAYGGDGGLLGWIRLPEGMSPFLRLNLEMADIVAYASLFAGILLASTVQLNSTISAADPVAARSPTSLEEARAQQRDLQTYANQAEMAMLVSFGAAFAVLLMTVLFGFAEIADHPNAGEVDVHGVGWVGFVEAAPGLTHPRIFFMYLVSFLLFLVTYASLPQWKHTGLFQRQVEDDAWEARGRLAVIAAQFDLGNVDAIRIPGGTRVAALIGYAVYVSGFALALNLSLAVFAGDEGFVGVFAAGRFPLFFLFVLIAVMLSSGVGAVMLRTFHLHAGRSGLYVVSLVIVFVAVFYVVWAEGTGWAVGLAVIMALYMALWVLLYRRSVDVLDRKDPRTWEFLLSPPKYLVIRRYEAIRRSADILRERGLADAADGNAPLTGQ
ncbi:hypothetical protein [Corynebacterium comes]|uniref:Uncharacterized protein n=1 Tax=Corynebacterium comes TaxID=2675218 RepID=A0A6B8VR80_9CORY|nr:hypothetical protein [Corynebacterium comes]QGU03854.1 hypothetical protein CETAM_02870 [Corynebacterium comes]